MKKERDLNKPWTMRVLRWICPPALFETIEGDLAEQFEIDLEEVGEKPARRRFLWNAMKFIRPGIIFRNKFSFELNRLDMLRHHLRFATRLFFKDKFFSLLNILGLALGIAVSIILLLILQNDLTYDQSHLNYKRIYRVGCHQHQTGLDFRAARSASELGTVLKEELPEIEAVVRAEHWNRTLVKDGNGQGDKSFYEEGIVETDPDYFQVFTHEFIAGDPKTCLSDIHTAVITESTAKKYFANTDPIGKSFLIDRDLWRVTGIIKDLPDNVHLKFDFLVSNRQWVKEKAKIVSEDFWNPGSYLYILVPENYDPKDFLAKFPALYDKYYKSFGQQVGGRYSPILEPLADIHFHSDLDWDEPHGNLAYVYAFTAVGIFIMLLACINYMNLTTARALNRATEIAVKKVVGSRKSTLVLSFLGESVLLSFLSLMLAIAIVFFVLKGTSFNQLIGMNIAPDFLSNRLLAVGALGIALGIGIVSGMYPAFYLPGISAINVLKGTLKNRKSGLRLRMTLITVQFAISIFVVVCTLYMKDQIDYVQNKELGFNKDNVLLLSIQDSIVRKQIDAIKNELLLNPHIAAATTSYEVLGMNIGGVKNWWAEGEAGMRQQGFVVAWVGDDYLGVMGMKIIQGRSFQAGPTADVGNAYIVNEAAARIMGWGNQALGKKLKFFHGEYPGEVIGVVKDFNFKSLHNKVEPLLILKSDQGGFLHLKVKGENLAETIQYIKKTWTRYDSNHPFEYFFLDQRFNDQYKSDQVQKTLLSGLAYICIFISLLGLIGLSAFSATQRTKEMGVRKALGANIADIIFLLSKNVLLLVVLASIIVIPVTYWVMNRWMANFAYRVELNYLLFAAVTMFALGFVFLTVLFQSLKTARSNPVDSLKYE